MHCRRSIALEVLPSEEPDVFLPVHAYMFATAGAQIMEVVNMEEIALRSSTSSPSSASR